ncbi:MAG: hypothetical protein GY760_03105, partial [Deltaproteobacteria bacterium]|nr:hypothetical protein [Deltaproteobacteria bacterium]
MSDSENEAPNNEVVEMDTDDTTSYPSQAIERDIESEVKEAEKERTMPV